MEVAIGGIKCNVKSAKIMTNGSLTDIPIEEAVKLANEYEARRIILTSMPETIKEMQNGIHKNQ